MECLTAHHWMYELNALSLEILSLIQNDNNLQKEFRLECSGQLPDLFVQSHRIIWGYLFICFLSTCINRQEICPDCILSVKIFFPTNAFCLTTCRFFCEQFIKEKMSNECDFVAEVVWKSAGIVQWDVCTNCFGLGLACIHWSLLSYRFKQISKTHFRPPYLFWLHAETTENTQLL